MSRLLTALLDSIIGDGCAACDMPGPPLCTRCRAGIPILGGSGCDGCGYPWPRPVPACPECIAGVVGARQAASYSGPVPTLVMAFKDHRRRALRGARASARWHWPGLPPGPRAVESDDGRSSQGDTDMELQVRGRNVPITDALEVHAEKRMHKIERVLGPFADKAQVEVELAVEHNPSIAKGQIAEVTVRTKGPVIRVREADSDMYAAIDLAAHRVERAAQRLRERHKDHHGPGIQAVAATPAEIAALDRLGKDATDAVESPPPIRIVRSKRFEMPSLTPEDAAVRLELIDHEFFVFRNEASGEVSVIYRRRDGDFGLIEGA